MIIGFDCKTIFGPFLEPLVCRVFATIPIPKMKFNWVEEPLPLEDRGRLAKAVPEQARLYMQEHGVPRPVEMPTSILNLLRFLSLD